jgi:hypothetical protein
MPAQPLLILGAGVDYVVAMIGEQPDIERPPVEVRAWEVLEPLFQRCSGDRERVDRVGLPALTRGSASARHVLRSDPHDALAARDEEPLERAAHVPAVLDRPDPLAVELARPPQQFAEASMARRRGQLATRPGGQRVDRATRVGLLVRVRPNNNHLQRPFELIS